MDDHTDESGAAEPRVPRIAQRSRRPVATYPGHEELCAEAVDYILGQPDHSVVVFAGPTGSGRGRLADAVLTRLAEAGYRRIPALVLAPVEESQHIHTVDDLLEQVAQSLPAVQLANFLEESRHWIGKRRSALLLDALRQRIDVPDATGRVADLTQLLSTDSVAELGSDQRESQTKKLAAALFTLLVDQGEPVVLQLNLTYATAELELLALTIAGLAAPPLGLLLIIDSESQEPWASTQAGIYRQVPDLQPDELEQLCRRQGLQIDDPAAIVQLHQLSAGLPELAELILDEVRRHARTTAELSQLLLARHTTTLDNVLRGVLSQLDEPLRAFYALDGLLTTGGLPNLQARERHNLFYRFAQEQLGGLLGAADWENRSTLVTSWLQQYDVQLRAAPELRWRMQQLAYQRIGSRDPDVLRNWSGWLAGYLNQQQVRDPLLIAYYSVEGDRLQTAREQIEPLFNEPAMAYGTRCVAPRVLLKRICELVPVGERANYAILAGDHASAEGATAEAKDWYYRALQDLARADLRCLSVFGKLMRAYQLPETDAAYAAMGRECAEQLANDAPPFLAALIKGWQAVASAAQGQMLASEERVQEAAGQLRAALSELEQHSQSLIKRDEQAVYRRERVFLADELARRELDLNNVPAAKKIFKQEHDALIHDLIDELLLARFKNNLGYVSYYIQGNTKGEARAYFEEALRIRQVNGDQVGAIRAAANLTGLLGEAARSAQEWVSAEQRCVEFSARARLLREVAPAIRMQSNLIEILIRRGAIEEARALIGQSLSDDPAGDYVPLLHLKLAWCDLWQGGFEQCRATLEELAEALTADDAPEEDWWEWAQCALELSLHEAIAGDGNSAAGLLPMAAKVTAEAESYRSTPRAMADGFYTYGLFHLAHDDPEAAIDYLGRCHTRWAPKGEIPHPFRAASAGVWLAYAERQAGRGDVGSTLMQSVDKELAPFGDTPTRRLLARIRGMRAGGGAYDDYDESIGQ